jgi:putative cell wall-binding protein
MRARLALAIVVFALVTAAPAAAEQRCVDDATDDTQHDSDGTPAPGHPRADVLQSCVDFGDVLEFTTRTAEPTSPLDDPRWNGTTQASWFLDTNADDAVDYHIAYALEVDRRHVVYAYKFVDGSHIGATIACEGTPTFDGTHYRAVVDPACLGAPDALRFFGRMLYDADETFDNGSQVYFDWAPSDNWSGSVARTPGRETSRVAGGSRIETAVAISRQAFPDRAASVYLARSDEFADAVAAGALSDGPVLLVPSCGQLPPAVRAEIDRVDPGRVVALGGRDAVCDELLDRAARDRERARLSGPSRVDTAIAIAQAAFPQGADAVYLSRADVFADAVAAGALTAGPVLLVPSCGDVPRAVRDEIRRLDAREVVALGGPGAVCDATLDQAAARRGNREVTTRRLAGDSRIATAIAISQEQFDAGARHVFLARADVLADAVAAGVLTTGPILLVPVCGDLPDAVAAEIARLDPQRVHALGGPSAVCDTVLRSAARR